MGKILDRNLLLQRIMVLLQNNVQWPSGERPQLNVP